MNRFQNWMTYSFNGVVGAQKQSPQDIFSLHFNVKEKPLDLSYKDALVYNAKVMRDMHREPFDVLLSGGIDSEAVVRSFAEAGISHNTFIFRYEDNLNIRDVNSSIQICEALNIPYKIIDFNLREFYHSSEAVELYHKTYVPNLTSLSRIKWLDYLDNIPVFGEGEPYWARDLGSDYSLKSNWCYHNTERELFISVNQPFINRPVVGEWFQYTPEVNASFYKDPLVQELINDMHIGKKSTLTSRLQIYKTFWPDIAYKSKLTGYEGPTANPLESIPDYFTKFANDNKIYENFDYKFKYSVENFETILLRKHR